MTDPRAVRWGWVIYRRLLALLQPGALRARYGEAMDAAFREQLVDAVARRGWVGWTAVMIRTARGAVEARFDDGTRARRGGGPRTGGSGVDGTNEARQAVRRLRRSPGFTAVAVASLAVGVGAFASVFGVASGILVAPLPYDDPAELVWLWRDYWGDFPRGWLSGADIVRLRDETRTFDDVAAFRTARVTLTDQDGSAPREVGAVLGSPGFVELLGVLPQRGPGFSPVAFAPDAPDEVMVSHGLWEAAFGADPDLVGRDVQVDGTPYRVVGVLPREMDFQVHSSLGTPRGGDLWFVLDVDLTTANVYSGQYAGLARIADGVGRPEVDAALARVSEAVDSEHFQSRGLRIWPVDLKEDLVADARAPLGALVGAAALLLLILGANLATLFLTRTEDRLRETSLRSALGAGRRALVLTALLEPALVAAAGLAGGLLVAAWATPVLARLGRGVLPRTAELGFDPRVVAGAGLAALLVAGLASTGPLLRGLTAHPGRGLGEGGRSGSSRSAVRTRSALVATQMALALALVVGAGLLTRSLQELLVQDPGFDPGSAVTFRVSFRGPGYADDGAIAAAQEAVRQALSEVPGVVSAGHVGALPLSQETDQWGVRFPGAPGNTGDPEVDGELADVFNVSPGYLETAGFRFLEGRAPRLAGPDAGGRYDVVIDDVFARRFFPDGGALGALVTVDTDTATIVGVVDQARLYAVEHDDRGQAYIPADVDPRSSVSFVVLPRAGTAMDDLVASLRAVVHAFDAGLPVDDVRPLGADVGSALAPDRLNLGLAATFALAALVLAGLGIYGVVAGAVTRRRREIGVRMAMGADARQVVAMILGRSARLTLAGTLGGLVLAAVLGRWLSTLLFGVTPFDPATWGLATLTLGLLALAASWLPARRATRIAPREALQRE